MKVQAVKVPPSLGNPFVGFCGVDHITPELAGRARVVARLVEVGGIDRRVFVRAQAGVGRLFDMVAPENLGRCSSIASNDELESA